MSDQPVLALALDNAPPFRPRMPDALVAVQRASLRVLEETGVAVGSPTV
jgi:trimethylamine:corrinoid methyltransferase-like protein